MNGGRSRVASSRLASCIRVVACGGAQSNSERYCIARLDSFVHEPSGNAMRRAECGRSPGWIGERIGQLKKTSTAIYREGG